MGCWYLKQGGRIRSVSNKDAIRLWLVVSWAGFSNQTTMIAITRGTKNEGSFVYTPGKARVTPRRLPSCSSCKSTKRKLAS